MTEEQYQKDKLAAQGMRTAWKMGDDLRDEGLTIPEEVAVLRNIVYGPYGKWNLLDLYRPKNTEEENLPVIVNIHGGGWEYGDKELYQFYGMALAKRGFAVVNFNYRLAPENAFPAAFIDVNRVMTWLAENAADYHMDVDQVFILGDSAGGHLASWYCTLLTSADYRALYERSFPIQNARREEVPMTREDYKTWLVPENLMKGLSDQNMIPDEDYSYIVPFQDLKVRACALNCGIYDMVSAVEKGSDTSFSTFMGALIEGESRKLSLELIDSWSYMNADFPPAFIMSATNDFLLPQAEPLTKHLQDLGAEAELHIYGKPGEEDMYHVFHVNQRHRMADECNDAECAYFRKHMK